MHIFAPLKLVGLLVPKCKNTQYILTFRQHNIPWHHEPHELDIISLSLDAVDLLTALSIHKFNFELRSDKLIRFVTIGTQLIAHLIHSEAEELLCAVQIFLKLKSVESFVLSCLYEGLGWQLDIQVHADACRVELN
jgi:hypothetical protein